jgi:hypothetical protein
MIKDFSAKLDAHKGRQSNSIKQIPLLVNGETCTQYTVVMDTLVHIHEKEENRTQNRSKTSQVEDVRLVKVREKFKKTDFTDSSNAPLNGINNAPGSRLSIHSLIFKSLGYQKHDLHSEYRTFVACWYCYPLPIYWPHITYHLFFLRM